MTIWFNNPPLSSMSNCITRRRTLLVKNFYWLRYNISDRPTVAVLINVTNTVTRQIYNSNLKKLSNKFKPPCIYNNKTATMQLVFWVQCKQGTFKGEKVDCAMSKTYWYRETNKLGAVTLYNMENKRTCSAHEKKRFWRKSPM